MALSFKMPLFFIFVETGSHEGLLILLHPGIPGQALSQLSSIPALPVVFISPKYYLIISKTEVTLMRLFNKNKATGLEPQISGFELFQYIQYLMLLT